MRLAVMQPYFFPYIGYFQLLQAADTFVFFDNVNFIKKGWINRNNVLQQNQKLPFTIPLAKVSQNKKIDEIEISDFPKWKNDFLKTISSIYKKAPHFAEVIELIEMILNQKEFDKISDLASASVVGVAGYMDMKVDFLYSSELSFSGNNGQEKILDICKLVKADSYVNPKNGAHLYDFSAFREQNIELLFLEVGEIHYLQFTSDNFVPGLSIIDVLMFNTKDQVLELLTKHKLLSSSEVY